MDRVPCHYPKVALPIGPCGRTGMRVFWPTHTPRSQDMCCRAKVFMRFTRLCGSETLDRTFTLGQAAVQRIGQQG
jgi:hypothetical protein